MERFINVVLQTGNNMAASLADTEEWKELKKKIAEANKDPAFREAVERFIEIASNHSK